MDVTYISFCCTDTKPEPWLSGLRAAIPRALVDVWQVVLGAGLRLTLAIEELFTRLGYRVHENKQEIIALLSFTGENLVKLVRMVKEPRRFRPTATVAHMEAVGLDAVRAESTLGVRLKHVQQRMAEWARMTPAERGRARLTFQESKQLTREQKQARWEAYQALSEEERSALAARAVPKPAGAATALRPVSPKKLAQVPAATQANPSRPNAPKIPPVLDHSAPRVAAPVTPTAPPATGVPTQNPASNVVETAPVSIPVAVPAALPPLGAGSAETPATTAPMVTPDNSGLYPQ